MSTSEIQDTLIKALGDDKTVNSTEENGDETSKNAATDDKTPDSTKEDGTQVPQVLNNLAGKIQNGEMTEEVSNNSEDGGNFSPHPPGKGESVSSSPKRAPRNKHENSDSSTSELSPLAQKFYDGEQVTEYDPHELKSCISELEAYCQTLMEQGSYQESRQAQAAVEAAQQAQLTHMKKQAQEKELKEVKNRKSDLQKKYTDFQTDMDRRQQQLEELLKQQYDDICQKHEIELEKHDEEWHSESKSRQFNRSSQTLRNLRTQQQLLLNAKRFEEALQIREIADQTEKIEIQQSQQAYINAYKQSRSLLKRKQANELDTYEMAANGRRLEFQHFRETKAIPYIKQFNALKIQEDGLQDENKYWIRKHRNDTIKKNSSSTRAPKYAFSKTVKVEKFNKLPLPGLPILQSKKSQSASNSARVSSQNASNSNRNSQN